MKKERLLEYCEKHKIMVPSGATVPYLERAIVRAYLNQTEVVRDEETCFGYWAHEDSACMVCDFEGKCFESSIGMKKEEYFKKLEQLESPRIRFVKKRLAKKIRKTPV